MVSKPALIVIVLMVAMLVSAVTGYTLYHSYRAPYNSLSKPIKLGEALDLISTLKYNVTSDGNLYFVVVRNNPSNNSGYIEILNASNVALGKYIYTYDESTGLLNVSYVDLQTGNTTTIDVAALQDAMYTGVQIVTLTGGGIIMQPTPSIAPLLFLYGIGDKFDINWETSSSNLADVRWSPINYPFQGEKHRGSLVVIEPVTLPVPVNEWSQVTLISVVAIKLNGHVVFPSISIEAGGQVLNMNLMSIQFSG